MASLQKIRNHGPLLIIVVGVAMLAFILGDVLTNVGHLRNSGIPNMGSVAGNKISSEDFERTRVLIENLEKNFPVEYIRLAGTDAQRNECEQLLTAFQEAQDKEGNEQELREIRDRVYAIAHSININAATWNTFVKYYTFKAQADALGMDISPEEYAELANGLPERVVKGDYLQQKYMYLLRSSFRATTMEAEFAFNNRQQNVTAEYVMLPYDAIDNASVTVSEADVEALYNRYKPYFRNDPYRKIMYVALDYTPTDPDFIKEAEYMADLQAEFSTTDDVELILKEEADEAYKVAADYTENTVPAELKDFAFGKDAKVGDCSPLMRDERAFTIARIMEINKAQKTVKLAVLRRSVIPSESSKMEMEQQFNQILREVSSVEELEMALREQGQFAFQATVGKMTQTVGNIQGSRKVVTWAFGASQGDVCREVFDCGDKMVIAAVTESQDGNYMSADHPRVSEFLQNMALQNAKAAYVAEAMPSINSLEEVAARFGQEVKSGTASVTLADNTFGEYYNEPAVVGAAFAQNAKGVITPIQGNSGVFFVKAGVPTSANTEFTEEAKNAEVSTLYNLLSQKYGQAIEVLFSDTENTIYDLERF
ncbi:MAG: peptidyl-prolyl cis-trans isomerase [Paludibacteraceae bacterium]|nr:peptidyl-prolyl cis-trans isomerase [Paludibacteraceae bacterium]